MTLISILATPKCYRTLKVLEDALRNFWNTRKSLEQLCGIKIFLNVVWWAYSNPKLEIYQRKPYQGIYDLLQPSQGVEKYNIANFLKLCLVFKKLKKMIQKKENGEEKLKKKKKKLKIHKLF